MMVLDGVCHPLDGRGILRVLLPVAELAQQKVLRQLDFIECVFHSVLHLMSDV